MLYATEGIILAQTDLGEYDRIATVLTRDEGLVKAVVKGARKPLSKLSAVTQPYSKATLQMFRGRSLDRITQAVLITSYPGIAMDYRKMVYAGFLAETLSSILPLRESNEVVFQFVDRVMEALEERPDPWPVAIWGVIGILTRTGFAPSFGACAVCGRSHSVPVYFSPCAGGTVCAKCRVESRLPEACSEVSMGAARTLDLLSSSMGSVPGVNARGSVRREATSALISYVSETLGRRPNSASLVERIEV